MHFHYQATHSKCCFICHALPADDAGAAALLCEKDFSQDGKLETQSGNQSEIERITGRSIFQIENGICREIENGSPGFSRNCPVRVSRVGRVDEGSA